MIKFLKITVLILTGIFFLSVFLVWLNYGVYDHRNFPTTLQVYAKTQPGYHVHLKVEFYRARNLRGVCKPLVDFVGGDVESKYDAMEVDYNDVTYRGTELELKKSWNNVCKYKMDAINITCTKTLTFPTGTVYDPLRNTAYIFPYQKNISHPTFERSQGSQRPYDPPVIDTRIAGNFLFIKYLEDRLNFYPCKKECESVDFMGIDSTDKILKIECKDPGYAF